MQTLYREGSAVIAKENIILLHCRSWYSHNDPDLVPLDYTAWSTLKVALNKHTLLRNFKDLKKLLIKEWNTIPQSLIRDSIDSDLTRFVE